VSASKSIGDCIICGRPMIEGKSVNEHHLIPKTYKGTETITLHVICHNKIHTIFTEQELFSHYHTAERIRSHPEMEKFVKWLQNKEPEFRSRHLPKRRK
jgi:hypothetical protein